MRGLINLFAVSENVHVQFEIKNLFKKNEFHIIKMKLINAGSVHLDSLVISTLLKGYAWARGDNDYNIIMEDFQKEADKIVQGLIPTDNNILSSREIINRLTTREKEVMLCLADRKSNRQIARELFLSYRTIETHKTNIMHKSGLSNIYGLYVFAFLNKYKIKSSMK